MIHCPPLSVTKEIIEIALVNFKSALILYLGPARNLSRERCNERRYSKHSSEKKQETDGKRIEEPQTCFACTAGSSSERRTSNCQQMVSALDESFTSCGVTQHRRRRVQGSVDDR